MDHDKQLDQVLSVLPRIVQSWSRSPPMSEHSGLVLDKAEASTSGHL